MRLPFALLLLLSTTVVAQSPPQLIGLWHSVSATTREGRDITPPGGGLELEFGRDGTLVQTIVSPAHAGADPIRYRGHYTVEPPKQDHLHLHARWRREHTAPAISH